MSQPKPLTEIWELFDAACDGRLSGAEVSRLETLLDLPENRQLYVDYCRMHADLHFRIRADQAGRRGLSEAMCESLPAFDPRKTSAAGGAQKTPANAVSLKSSPAIPILLADASGTLGEPPEAATDGWSGTGFRSGIFFLLGSIVSLVGVGIWFLMHGPLHEKPVAQRPLGLSSAVAYLTVDNGAVWSGGLPEIRNVGSAVNMGDEISLHEGIAEFRLSSGVSLSVEGPASLIIQSPTSLVLAYGKLTANVPWTVTDFRASVGPCQFTACDAEFGLYQQGNTLDVHVFSGEVRAASRLIVYERSDSDKEVAASGTILTDDSGTFARATIMKGSALSLVAQDGQLKVADKGRRAKPELFTTKISMAGPLPITPSYVDAVLAAKPWGYWRFEKIEDGRVPNEVSGGIPLKAMGELRLTGPQGNLAAEFQPGVESYLISETLVDALADNDYSLELWVKPSHPHHGNLLLIGHEESSLCGFALEVQGLLPGQYLSHQNRGTFRFVHTNNMLTGQEKLGTSCYSKEPYANRRWQHVVGVKAGAEMRLFVDGKLSATNRERTTQPTDLRVILGSQRVDYGGRRFFIGQLDEVAIYGRALSEQEVAEHHRLGSQAAEKP